MSKLTLPILSNLQISGTSHQTKGAYNHYVKLSKTVCRFKIDSVLVPLTALSSVTRRWTGLVAACPQRILTGLQQPPSANFLATLPTFSFMLIHLTYLLISSESQST